MCWATVKATGKRGVKLMLEWLSQRQEEKEKEKEKEKKEK